LNEEKNILMQTLNEDLDLPKQLHQTPSKSAKDEETEEARLQTEHKEIESLMEEFKNLQKKGHKLQDVSFDLEYK